MYKIYEFYKEPCDDKSECLVADIKTEELAYKCMLGCFTTRNNSGKKYYSFADDAVHADIIRAKLWYNIDRSKTGFVLYTVYAFNKTGETTHVYPMRVFTEYRDALDEALKFGSFCNDWIFLVDTSIDDARINYTIHHCDTGDMGKEEEGGRMMKPEYYIYSWQAGAFRSGELSRSLKGYTCRKTAERIAKFRFDGMHDRIRYCVALTDDEAFVKMTRQNMPNTYYDTDDAEKCHKCRRLFRVRYGMFGDYPCDSCITNYYDTEENAYVTNHCVISEWRNPSEKKG